MQHEKKPVSNLKRMQNVGFEQTSTKFIEISFCKNNFFRNNFFRGKKP